MATLISAPAFVDHAKTHERDLRARRARLVFVGLYALAALALLWCAVPWPGSTSTGALLPLVVGVQVLGAMGLLGWLLRRPARSDN
jgi:hypothetical protein